MSILFESLSYETGGTSFFIQSKKDELSIYMSLLDALREIRARSESNGPVLVHTAFTFNKCQNKVTTIIVSLFRFMNKRSKIL